MSATQWRSRADKLSRATFAHAIVATGDWISLDVPGRTLTLLVGDAELARRRAAWQPPAAKAVRGYGWLFLDETTQADRGCDFRFLERGDPPAEPEIF